MKRLGLLALIAGCSGETGTIQLGVTTAPGSALLDGVEVLRVTLTEPPTVVEAPRTANGFDLVMDVEATGIGAALIIEGFDGAGSLLATGMSPQFAVSALDARIVIYLAAPMTIAPSPAPLPAARIGVASTPLTYGFALAGGEDVAGTRTDSIFIYNTFDHSLLAGSTMPAVRSFQTLATGNNNNVYLFGGLGSDGAPTGSLWRFDTNVQPAGAYSLSPDQVDLARDHASAITLETERILITGTPPIDLTFGTPTARTDIPALTTGTSVIVDNRPLAVFSGDPLLRLRDGVFEELAYGSEPGASLAAVGEFVVVPSFRGTTEFAVVTPANLDNPGMFLDRLGPPPGRDRRDLAPPRDRRRPRRARCAGADRRHLRRHRLLADRDGAVLRARRRHRDRAAERSDRDRRRRARERPDRTIYAVGAHALTTSPSAGVGLAVPHRGGTLTLKNFAKPGSVCGPAVPISTRTRSSPA
jgi:hypothetical protein